MAKAATRVGDLATKKVVTLKRNQQLSVADDLMKQKRIRHLPVLDEWDKVCGIVSQRDLFRGALVRALGFGSRAEEQMLKTLLVKEVMTEEVFTTTADATLAEAAGTMLKRGVGCLPVLDDGKLVGILTESDFLKVFAQPPG